MPFVLRSTDDFSVDQDDHLYNLAGFAWAMSGLTKGDGLTTTVPIGGALGQRRFVPHLGHDEVRRAVPRPPRGPPVPKSLRSTTS